MNYINIKNNKIIIEEKLLNIDVNKKEDGVGITNNTESDNDCTSSTCSDEEDNNGTINGSKYTPEEWENLSVAKQVQILNQQKIDNYNKACREFDKKINRIDKQLDEFGEYVPISKALQFLNDNCNVELDTKLIEDLQEDKRGYALTDDIKSMIHVAPKDFPEQPVLNRRCY